MRGKVVFMFKLIKQHDIKDCGAACLSMICRHNKLMLPMAKFRELIKVDNNGANIYGIVNGAEKLGLLATALIGKPDEFLDSYKKREFKLPIIARVILDGVLEHYVVVYKVTSKHFYIADPAKGKQKYSYKDFFKIWAGNIIVFEKSKDFQEKNECKGTLKRYFNLIKNQKKLLWSVTLFSLLISVISIAGTLVFKFLIDGIEKGQLTYFGISFGKYCACILALYLFQAGINFLRGYYLTVLSKNVDLPLMLSYYNHIVDLPIKDINNRKSGEFLSRFNDASNITNAISSTVLSLILDTIMVLICSFVLYSISHFLFFVAMTILIIYAIVSICYIYPIKNINEKEMEKNAEVTAYLKESIDGIETVKAFCAENTVKNKTKSKFDMLVKYSMKSSMFLVSQSSISGFISSSGIIILLWIGAKLVLQNELTVGTLITFYSLLGYFLDPIQRLINLQPSIQTAVVAAERLNDILDIETESNNICNEEIDGDIKIKNLDFRYGNRELVLENIDMEIKKGESIALIGESGSGKTTLAKLLLAFYKPEKGDIIIGKNSVFSVSSQTIRKNIAYVSQDMFLFSDSVRNNLTLGDEKISMEDIESVCNQSMASEFIEKMPLGYDTFIGENGNDISGGQKQRLAIARALLKKPKILILDEATSNLDTITEMSIKKIIDSLRGRITVIIIAHRLSTIKNCDRIYIMDNGKIIESGTHNELIKNSERYKSYYTAQ